MKAVWLSVGMALLSSQAAVAGHLTHSQRTQQNDITQTQPSANATSQTAQTFPTVTTLTKSCAATKRQSATVRLQQRESYARVLYRPSTGSARQPDRDDCRRLPRLLQLTSAAGAGNPATG